MSISLIHGLPGSGKSHFSLFYGLALAEKYGKVLVSNFLLNLDNLAQYCYLSGYYSLLDSLGKQGIVYISADSHAADFLSVRNAVIILDEAGIYFPARSYRDTPKRLLADLCQVRHDASLLLCISQSSHQIDKQIRGLAWEYFHCRGTSLYDKTLNNQKLIFKNIYRFDADRYEQWIGDPKLRKNPLKSRLCSNKTWQGTLSCADKFLFTCFDSFARLDQKQEYDDDYQRVIDLTKDSRYYFDFGNYEEFPSTFARDSNCIYVKTPFNKLIATIFTKLPAVFLLKVLKLANLLTKFSGFNALEKIILNSIFAFLIGGALCGFLSVRSNLLAFFSLAFFSFTYFQCRKFF